MHLGHRAGNQRWQQRARRTMANQPAGKAPSDSPALKPYRGKLAVRNFRGGNGNVGIIRSPVRAIALPDKYRRSEMNGSQSLSALVVLVVLCLAGALVFSRVRRKSGSPRREGLRQNLRVKILYDEGQ